MRYDRAPLRRLGGIGKGITMAIIAVAGFGFGCAPSEAGPNAPERGQIRLTLTPPQREALRKSLESRNARYDPKEKMLGSAYFTPGYHSHLKTGSTVHSTRDSLTYAASLLDTGDPDLFRRGEDIIRRVIALQDQDPESKTYGIWSWYLEEPLAEMSPPDWNWADFCGVPLLQAVLYHRDELAPDLVVGIDAAIRHAAYSIRRRNVGMSYTNIAVMGTYVTLVYAETYGDVDMKAYAMDRLKRFTDYSQQQGAFSEYNSPTYTVVALKEIARLRNHVRDATAKKQVETIYRMAWEEIATHFHAPTRQWAGPHSRTYNELTDKGLLGMIERATDGRVDFGVGDRAADAEQFRLPLPSPPEFDRYFTTLDAPRQLRKTFLHNDLGDVVGTTYLAPEFALGSINQDILWNQRRPLNAYWGTAARPAYLRLRFLHDGYDFASARYNGVQEKGRVLAVVNIATDGGDTHPSLDRVKDGTITAKDLRLRFEFGGAAAGVPLTAPATLSAPVSLDFGSVNVGITVPYARLADSQGHWESGVTKDKKPTAFLDVVLYSGAARTFRLADLEAAAVGIALSLQAKSGPITPAVALTPGNALRLEWDGMTIQVPMRPDKAAVLIKDSVLSTGKLSTNSDKK